jgi:hypothetical protein
MITLPQTRPHAAKSNPLIWIIVACLAVLFFWRIMTGTPAMKPPFTDKDKVLANVPWSVDNREDKNFNVECYAWLDNETLIYVRPNGQHSSQLMRQRVRGKHFSAAEPFFTFAERLNPIKLSVSPNGKWLMVTEIGSQAYRCSVYAINGSGLKQRYEVKYASPIWLADGESFLNSETQSGELYQYSVATHQRKKLAFKQHLNAAPVASPQGEYFASDYNSQNNPPLKLERGSISQGKSQVQAVKSTLATEEAWLQSVSPQGTRLLWHRGWGDKTRFPTLWEKIRGDDVGVNFHATWWVTDTEGNHAHKLATVHFDGYEASFGSEKLRWLPDSKHLSVVYKGALYVIAVP